MCYFSIIGLIFKNIINFRLFMYENVNENSPDFNVFNSMPRFSYETHVCIVFIIQLCILRSCILFVIYIGLFECLCVYFNVCM